MVCIEIVMYNHVNGHVQACEQKERRERERIFVADNQACYIKEGGGWTRGGQCNHIRRG